MLLIPAEELMDPDERLKWHEIETLLVDYEASSHPNDPWLFHGTHQAAALSILEDGFDPGKSYAYRPGPGPERSGGDILPCVYWTNRFETARNFATKQAGTLLGLPVVFVARASDLAQAGTLVPDYTSWDINFAYAPSAEPADWKDSLEKFGAIAVVDCCRVPNLQYHCPGPVHIFPSKETRKRNAERYIANIVVRDHNVPDDGDEMEITSPAI